jgi:2-polyprenyl-6-methoxyphenol hydroxylase-like FAD-dependent oxidoreductase
MQFHLDGFRPGDPSIADATAALPPTAPDRPLPDDVDVLIVGSGPTGLTLAAQLAAFPDLSLCLAEAKPGPLQLGQADGIACRTMEMFQAFGFADRVLKEAYWVNETVFWKPDPDAPHHIRRSDRIQDVEDGLSEMPHVILNQARVHDFYLELMRHSPSGLVPHYGRRLLDVDLGRTTDHHVAATFERSDGTTETVRARYVVGCDGARSQVRRSIGRELVGDAANHAWGVMDVLAVTDFPDIRFKCIIHASEGNIIVIPREGGYLVRIYVELGKLRDDERVHSRDITVEQLIAAANRVFAPYTVQVGEVAWWSVYEIGQRLCDRFDDVPVDEVPQRLPRVFIAGDACHTHSPKAGQGMNVSMRDGFNLGWKLASVLRRQCRPEILHSYSEERRAVAKQLIDFDRELSAMMGARPKMSADDAEGVDPIVFQQYFQQHGRFTAGVATQYRPSTLTGGVAHQRLAAGFLIGTRFHSAPVVRLADARPMQLGHVIAADGRWRLFAFADAPAPDDSESRLAALCRLLSDDPRSPVVRFTPTGADGDVVFDVRAVLQQSHRSLTIRDVPTLLRPTKGRFGLVDHEKVFCPDLVHGPDIFELRGVDRADGALVLVRPDQHVAHVLPLDAFEELVSFFDAFMLEPG